MPIFEYRCRGCGTRFEHLILGSEPSPTCPSCDVADVEKMMSAAAVGSEHTQKRALRGAKERTDKVRFEREWESHKTAHDHDDH